MLLFFFFCQAEDGIRDAQESRGLGDVYKRQGTVGFALTILQRRLASSPEAIYQSLRRRRERLELSLIHI